MQVEEWLREGQDVEKMDTYGNTALLLAAEKGLHKVPHIYHLSMGIKRGQTLLRDLGFLCGTKPASKRYLIYFCDFFYCETYSRN